MTRSAFDLACEELEAKHGWCGWPGSPHRRKWIQRHRAELVAAIARHQAAIDATPDPDQLSLLDPSSQGATT